MIDSYKNIERLRYRINIDLEEIKEEIEKESVNWIQSTLFECVSLIMAAFASA